MGFPSKIISPEEGVRRPAIRERIVVFPQPLGPTKDAKSFSWTLKVTLSRAFTSLSFV